MKKVLIVEDNKALSSILRVRLEHDGFSVDLIEGGDALLGHLRTGKEPDAIILDLMLPGRSGVELLGTLTSIWKASRVYIFSGHPEYWERHRLKDYDTAGYFCKADGIDKLIDAIKEGFGGIALGEQEVVKMDIPVSRMDPNRMAP